ncbi:hypothetical protein [Kosakonia sp. S42]|uniref:hypothetical protein n=1 Tax=Kosakonia sp. S42 TaxID=2767458 RepID=UPI00190AECB0|nr:hypothetical protein [Kosakonia sp. S42]MBK0018741.1 hypothetical protein [Kosakonia sp. S42]
MNRLCYALSRRAGGLFDLGMVTGEDYLYFFEKTCPSWAEPCEIIFDMEEMRLAWNSGADLFAILEGSLPQDDVQVKQALVSRIFSTADDALIPQAVVRVDFGLSQGVPSDTLHREHELFLPDVLREPEKFTYAFLAIRRALAVQNGSNVVTEALEALAFLEDQYHRFREALRTSGCESESTHDLDVYARSLNALRDWLLTSPVSFPPQLVRLQFLYLETGPRIFQQTTARVQAELRKR